MNNTLEYFDKQKVAHYFGRASAHYDQHAAFQREVGERLLAKFENVYAPVGLDLGCGTGHFLPYLQTYCDALLGLDLSSAMLTQAAARQSKAQLIEGDAERLPFAASSLDWVYSNLALQWCNNLSHCLAQLHRCVRVGGRVFFSTLLEGSLFELEQAWQSIDSAKHVNRFLSKAALLQAIEAAGWKYAQVDTYWHSLSYAEPCDLLKELKGIGANYVPYSDQGLTTPSKLRALMANYPRSAANSGKVLASYHLALGELIRE